MEAQRKASMRLLLAVLCAGLWLDGRRQRAVIVELRQGLAQLGQLVSESVR